MSDELQDALRAYPVLCRQSRRAITKMPRSISCILSPLKGEGDRVSGGGVRHYETLSYRGSPLPLCSHIVSDPSVARSARASSPFRGAENKTRIVPEGHTSHRLAKRPVPYKNFVAARRHLLKPSAVSRQPSEETAGRARVFRLSSDSLTV